ncbi:hypothetical protein MMC27_002267 [Xylographa pallens]|nr:hypothetical protein [Xylographa pallens]
MPAIELRIFEESGDTSVNENGISHALSSDYGHFDTASNHDNEILGGKTIRASGIPSEEVTITDDTPPGGDVMPPRTEYLLQAYPTYVPWVVDKVLLGPIVHTGPYDGSGRCKG